MSAIDKLAEDVAEAVREYDRSNDHLRHEPGADCIRCHLLQALPGYARRIDGQLVMTSSRLGEQVGELMRSQAWPYNKLERLQRACNLMNNTRTDAIIERLENPQLIADGHRSKRLCDLTAEQWLKIYDAYHACGWDFTPDQWTDWQIKEALQGRVPRWDGDERPIDDDPRRLAEARANAVERGAQ